MKRISLLNAQGRELATIVLKEGRIPHLFHLPIRQRQTGADEVCLIINIRVGIPLVAPEPKFAVVVPWGVRCCSVVVLVVEIGLVSDLKPEQMAAKNPLAMDNDIQIRVYGVIEGNTYNHRKR